MANEELDQWLRRIAGSAYGLVRAPALLITALPSDRVLIADQGHTLRQIRRRLDVASLHRGVGGRLFRSWLRHRGLSEANGVLFAVGPHPLRLPATGAPAAHRRGPSRPGQGAPLAGDGTEGTGAGLWLSAHGRSPCLRRACLTGIRGPAVSHPPRHALFGGRWRRWACAPG